ncbi:MAG: hypothetical protein KUL86_09200 [Castellaniella sp.]|nr:hypothetical protein [Castellaniella sp.]
MGLSIAALQQLNILQENQCISDAIYAYEKAIQAEWGVIVSDDQVQPDPTGLPGPCCALRIWTWVLSHVDEEIKDRCG